MNRLFFAMMTVLMLPLTALADEPVPEEVWICVCEWGSGCGTATDTAGYQSAESSTF